MGWCFIPTLKPWWCKRMNPVDIVFGVFIAVMALKGFIKGFIRELFGLIALLIGIFLAHTFHSDFGQVIVKFLHVNQTTAITSAFFIIFFLSYIVIFFIGVIIASMIRKIDLGFFDRVFGFTFGVTKAAIVIIVIVLVFDSFSFMHSLSKSLKKDSYIYSLAERLILSTNMMQKVEQIVIKRGKST